MIVPDREQFCARASQGNLIPVYREILADRLTPVSAFERLTANSEGSDSSNAFLLESVEGADRLGRYSILGNDASLVFRSKGRTYTLTENGATQTFALGPDEDPLTVLQRLMERYRYVTSPDLPKFCGGAVGFLAYDVVRFFERLPDQNVDELNVDDACFLFTDTLLIFDHVRHRITALCNAHVTGDPEEAYALATARIESMLERLRAPVAIPPVRVGRAAPVKSLWPREEYEAAVERCRQYILAGDAFQVVLSQRFQVEFSARPFDLYRALRSVNPSPYMYYLSIGDQKVIGTSPEILVSVEGATARLRPIAGTRPRGANQAEDAALAAELLADEKERAEHIMLVDLSRNDLGRVCEFGTVHVNELMVIERYSHVIHIVSDVTGTLRSDKSLYDVLRACFPHGTVSGAPKVRAMEIIDEQEPTRRGLYAGSVGYLSYSGDMDMAIAIRTMLIKGQTAYLQSGGGLVADSKPAMEYQECLNKAKALVSAIELAEQGLE